MSADKVEDLSNKVSQTVHSQALQDVVDSTFRQPSTLRQAEKPPVINDGQLFFRPDSSDAYNNARRTIDPENDQQGSTLHPAKQVRPPQQGQPAGRPTEPGGERPDPPMGSGNVPDGTHVPLTPTDIQSNSKQHSGGAPASLHGTNEGATWGLLNKERQAVIDSVASALTKGAIPAAEVALGAMTPMMPAAGAAAIALEALRRK